MVFCNPMSTSGLRVTSLLLAVAFLMPSSVLAVDDFSDWQPRPLVDTSKPAAPVVSDKPREQAPKQQAKGPSRAEIEQMLKPAEPFIQDVEAKLALKPKPGTGLLERLNKLQLVLFGERKHNDAGELLAELATIFPEEAAKAHATLMAQMKQAQPQAQMPAAGNQQASRSSGTAEMYPPAGGTRAPEAMYPPSGGMQPQVYAQPQPPQKQTARKRGWWQDDDDWSDFENDDFFNDRREENYSQGGGSRLRSLGSGLASLAMVAGSLAGGYYLNKKFGGNNGNIVGDPNMSGYYPNGYYPYDPYGYGAYPYYGNPYGTSVLPGGLVPNGVMPNGVMQGGMWPGQIAPYGYYAQPGQIIRPGGQMIQQPYNRTNLYGGGLMPMPGGLIPMF